MKNLFLAAIAVFTIGATSAQDMKFGAKAGLNLANISGDSDNSVRTAFYVGGLAEIKISDKFAFQPELLYSSQGSVSKSISDVSVQFDYLNIPLMAKYMVAEGFNLEVGPQIGILLASKVKASSVSVDFKEFTNTVDFGLNFGAGYEINENLEIGARYGLGFTNVLKDTVTKIDNKNSVIQIGVAFKF